MSPLRDGSENRLFISHTAADNIFIEQHIVPLASRYFSDHFYSNYRTGNAATYKEHILTGLTNCRWIIVVLSAAATRSAWMRYELACAFLRPEHHFVIAQVEACETVLLHRRLPFQPAIDFTTASPHADTALESYFSASPWQSPGSA